MPAETVYDVLIRAQHIAAECSHAAVAASHLTLALLDCDAEDRASQLLNLGAIKRDEMRIYVEAALDGARIKTQTGAQPRPFAAISAMLRDAAQQAHDYNEPENQNALLLIALVAQRSDNGKILRSLGLQPGAMRLQLRNLTRAAKANGNPLKMLDADAQSALDAAHQIMRATGCGQISTAHLLLGILANREVYALQSLADNGVDLDELAHLARAAIASDGEIATAQIRPDKGAKRALERARDIVPSRTRRKPISPQAILWSLLPHPVTLRERWKWGEIEEPLVRVWSKVDVAPIERVLCVLLGLDMPELSEVTAKEKKPTFSYIFVGMIWGALCVGGILGGGNAVQKELWLGTLWAVFGVALLLMIWSEFKQSAKLRSGATEFMAGCALIVAFVALYSLFSGK